MGHPVVGVGVPGAAVQRPRGDGQAVGALLDFRAFWADVFVYNAGLRGGDNYPIGGTPETAIGCPISSSWKIPGCDQTSAESSET